MTILNRLNKDSFGAAFSAALLGVLLSKNSFAETHHAPIAEVEETLHSVEDMHLEPAHAAHGAHGAADVGLPQLATETYTSQIFWFAVAFLVMYLAFSKKLLPNISEILERRRETIASDLDTAESLRDEAESVQAEYEEAIAKAQSDGAALLAELNAKIKAEIEAEHNSFKESSYNEVLATQKKAQKASQALLAELQSNIPELTSSIVDKLTGIKPTQKEAETAVSSQTEDKAKAA